MAPEMAAQLLEDVIYERVAGFVDFEGLFHFEIELRLALGESGAKDAEISALAKQMIDRALANLPQDPRRYFAMQPFGQECELCEEEAIENARKKRKGGRS